MSLNRLVERLREMRTIRRDSTPLSVAIGLAQEAADELDRLQASERSAWNAAVERDERIDRLQARVAELEGALADIAYSKDMTLETAQLKAARIYGAKP